MLIESANWVRCGGQYRQAHHFKETQDDTDGFTFVLDSMSHPSVIRISSILIIAEEADTWVQLAPYLRQACTDQT